MMAAAISFLHRRPGDEAVHVGGRSVRIDRAVRVVLEAPDGRVLVTSIQRQGDGTLIGEVYRVMPNQRSVAVGDLVQFEESQIFRFRTPDELSDEEKVVDDIAQMASTFEQRFRELSGWPEKPPEVSNEAADLFAEAKAWNASERAEAQPRETPAAAAAAPPPAPTRVVDPVPPSRPPAAPAPVPAAPTPAAAPPPVTPAAAAPSDATARVSADAAREETEVSEAPTVAPAPDARTAAPVSAPTEPLTTPQPPPTPAPSAAPQSFKCIECGTRLTIPPPAEGATAEPIKIVCPACGRINRPPAVWI